MHRFLDDSSYVFVSYNFKTVHNLLIILIKRRRCTIKLKTEIIMMSHLTWNPPRQQVAAAARELPAN
jgi:hypothetical protein